MRSPVIDIAPTARKDVEGLETNSSSMAILSLESANASQLARFDFKNAVIGRTWAKLETPKNQEWQ